MKNTGKSVKEKIIFDKKNQTLNVEINGRLSHGFAGAIALKKQAQRTQSNKDTDCNFHKLWHYESC